MDRKGKISTASLTISSSLVTEGGNRGKRSMITSVMVHNEVTTEEEWKVLYKMLRTKIPRLAKKGGRTGDHHHEQRTRVEDQKNGMVCH